MQLHLIVLSSFIILLLLQISEEGILKNSVEVEFVRFERCPGKQNLSDYGASIIKYNRTHKAIVGHLNLPFDVDRSVSVKLKMDKQTTTRWQENFYVYEQSDVCRAMKYIFGPFWNNILSRINSTEDVRKCPISKGHYYVKPFSNKITNIPLPLFEGTYKIEINVIKDKIPQFCWMPVIFVYKTY